jgi:hypothetical protein
VAELWRFSVADATQSEAWTICHAQRAKLFLIEDRDAVTRRPHVRTECPRLLRRGGEASIESRGPIIARWRIASGLCIKRQKQ